VIEQPQANSTDLSKFFRFGAIGVVGFGVDAAVLQAAISLFAISPYAGRVASYLAAATTTWWLNRNVTFRETLHIKPARQWARFLVVNMTGGIANYAVFAALVATVQAVALHPVLGVAAGSLTGLVFNFLLSKKFAFTV